jgi:YesN/AraC family two-component response regulator
MGQVLQKILYVDDEEINLMFFALNFKRDFEVITTPSPLEALKMLNEDKSIRLLVTDFRMPVMNGIELIKAVKEIDPGKICIIVTGFLRQHLELDTESQSLVHSFILKPWKKEELKKIFNSVFES